MLRNSRVWRVSLVARDEELTIGRKSGSRSHTGYKQREEEKWGEGEEKTEFAEFPQIKDNPAVRQKIKKRMLWKASDSSSTPRASEMNCSP